MQDRIPKIIHYFWFGGKELPESALKCIESWKKYCPDYEIRRWDESNYDVNACRYTREAYEAKKWAFVSDYARLDILYRYGGVYFDTDVELIHSIDDMLREEAFMGCEVSTVAATGLKEVKVNPGIGCGARPGTEIVGSIKEYYDGLSREEVISAKTITEHVTEFLATIGFDGTDSTQLLPGIKIYSSEYFGPMDNMTAALTITDNTRSIHHYDGSWMTPAGMTSIKISRAFSGKGNVVRKFGVFVAVPFRFVNRVETDGVKNTLKYSVKLVSEKWALMFLIALSLYIIGACIDETQLALTSGGNLVSNIFKGLSLLILGIEAIMHIKTYSKRQWICFVILGIVSIICTIKSHSYCPILLMAFWINMAEVTLEGITDAFFISRAIAFIVTIILCFFGVLQDWVFDDACHTLGYGHPNALGIGQMLILLLYLVRRDRKVRWLDILGGVVFSVIVYAVCKSKSALIGSTLVLILFAINKLVDLSKIRKPLIVIATAFPAIMCLISIITAILYDSNNEIMRFLNWVFTGRLDFGKTGINTFGITTFGKRIEWINYGTGYNIVDNGFLQTLLIYGWIYLIIIVALHCLLGYYICKKEKWAWLIMFLVIMIHSFVEGTLITICRNPAIVAVGILFFCYLKVQKKTEITDAEH